MIVDLSSVFGQSIRPPRPVVNPYLLTVFGMSSFLSQALQDSFLSVVESVLFLSVQLPQLELDSSRQQGVPTLAHHEECERYMPEGVYC